MNTKLKPTFVLVTLADINQLNIELANHDSLIPSEIYWDVKSRNHSNLNNPNQDQLLSEELINSSYEEYRDFLKFFETELFSIESKYKDVEGKVRALVYADQFYIDSTWMKDLDIDIYSY